MLHLKIIALICITLTLYLYGFVIRCRQEGRQNILQALTTELHKVFMRNALVQPTMRFNVLGLKPQRVSYSLVECLENLLAITTAATTFRHVM